MLETLFHPDGNLLAILVRLNVKHFIKLKSLLYYFEYRDNSKKI